MQDFAQVTTANNVVEPEVKPITKKLPNVFSLLGQLLAKLNLKKVFSRKRVGTYLFVIIVASAVLLGLRNVVSRATSPIAGTKAVNSASVVSTPVNREFSFAAYDKSKKLSDPVSYIITEAQLTNQIIIKGQRATAVVGRQFLIINLKLVNDSNKSLFLNTRNYVRVQPQGSSDKLAPEIHNDTVEIQPSSTKITRIGLPVNKEVNEFTIFIGELEGDKEEIAIKF